MYTEFYGFSENPFHVTPDPRFLYLTPSHREALASMIYGIKERKGFISITGEVGTGKTTLIHSLLDNLNESVKAVFIFHTSTTFEQLMENILLELDLPVGGESKAALLHQFNEYLIQLLSRGETLAIIIDEAQNLPTEAMEELRMLSNLETSTSKLVQIVFVGQPELEVKLNSDHLRQLKQRIGIRRHIMPLSLEESRQYIEHRLNLVGSNSSKVFTPDAISMIIGYAQGIPRTINIVCDNAFLIGYGASSKKRIDAQIIKEVVSDMNGLIEEKPNYRQVPVPSVSPRHAVVGPSLYEKVISVIFSPSVLFFFFLGILGFFFFGFLQKYTTYFTDKMYMNNFPSVKHDAFIEIRPRMTNTAQSNFLSTNPSLDSEEKKMQTINVAKGDYIIYLTKKYYQISNKTLIDFILEANPEITDFNLIKINQKIKIPELTEELLIMNSSDNTFKIHVGTFATPEAAKQFVNEPALTGKKIDTIPLKVS
ncbi:MAG: AAA family ATPase, partial [Proteobacteria bacterium]|nr:AAA family ATPase [Pseudomonadota bacterium]